MQQKAFDYITKPLDMGYLLKRARKRRNNTGCGRLLRSEQRYQSLIDDVLEVSQVALMIVDAEHRVAWMNRAMERFFCFQRHAVLGREVRAFIAEDLAPAFDNPAEFQRIAFAAYDNNAYPEHFECRVTESEDRKGRWLEHWSQPIVSGLYAGGRIEQYVDITTRKRAEEDLRQPGRTCARWPITPMTGNLAGMCGGTAVHLAVMPAVPGYDAQEFMEDPRCSSESSIRTTAPRSNGTTRKIHGAGVRQSSNSASSRKTGASAGFIMRASRVRGGRTVPGRRACFQDITDRRAVEEQLKAESHPRGHRFRGRTTAPRRKLGAFHP